MNRNFWVNRRQHDADHLFLYPNPHIYKSDIFTSLQPEIIQGLVNGQEKLTLIGLIFGSHQIKFPF